MSRIEAFLFALIDQLAVVQPFRQVRVRVRVRGRVRPYALDVAWPDALVAIEIDGHPSHRTPEGVAHDAERDGRLVDEGWLVYRVRADDERAATDQIRSMMDEINASVRTRRETIGRRAAWNAADARSRTRATDGTPMSMELVVETRRRSGRAANGLASRRNGPGLDRRVRREENER